VEVETGAGVEVARGVEEGVGVLETPTAVSVSVTGQMVV
jgi:hypothetical protein